jgi:hypothetical protein
VCKNLKLITYWNYMYKDDDDDDGIEIKAAESFVRISKNLPKIYNKELIKVD